MKTQNYPDKIRDLQDRAETLYRNISKWTAAGDDSQLGMSVPGIQFLITKVVQLRAGISESRMSTQDELTCEILMQEEAVLEIMERDLKETGDNIAAAIDVIDASEKKVRMAEIMNRCEKLASCGERLDE